MLLSYKFSNFCGCVHKNGNILFSKDKNYLFSAIGNKITVFDLENNIAQTLPCQNRSDISKMAISPNSKILVSIDKDGYGLIINIVSKNVINHYNFKDAVTDVQFSPDGRFLAVSSFRDIRIFESPTVIKNIEPLILFKKYHGGHNDEIKTLTWSPDSRFILSTSSDNTVRMSSVYHLHDYVPFCFTGHKSSVVRAFFSEDMMNIYTISKDGLFIIWKWMDDYISEGYTRVREYENFKVGKKIKLDNNKDKRISTDEIQEKDPEEYRLYSEFEKKVHKGRFIMHKKQQFQQSGSKVKSVAYGLGDLFIIGFRNGVFGLYKIETDEIQSLQTFNISDGKITSICFNSTGNWIGFSCSDLGQLMVWEWRSQTYILNQQGLFYDVSIIDYSPNGNVLATGGHDGKIRLWDTKSFMCFATFNEHSSKITGLKFITQNTNTLISSSLDGTVRAYDTMRYRNFRTMIPEISTQLTCLAVDPYGDIICAGSMDPYNVYCWSLKTGHLVDIITGHEGPISSLAFSPVGNMLASGSWDKTVRVTDIYEKTRKAEVLDHNSEVMDLTFRSDGKELCCATLKGEIYLWNHEEGQVTGIIDGRKDIGGGRLESESRTAKNSTSNKHFLSLCYSADGDYILAGGNTKYICLYELRHRVLLKKFILTTNRSLDGIFDKLNTKNIKDGININEIDEEIESDFEDRKDNILPGAKKPENMKKNNKLKIECRCVKFSPNGKLWSAATTEGVSVYSYDEMLFFSPSEFDESLSIEAIKKLFINKDYYNCLMAVLKLNDTKLLEAVYENIPAKSIPSISQAIPRVYLERFLSFLAMQIEKLPCIQYNMLWLDSIIHYHSSYLREFNMNTLSIFRNIIKNINVRSSLLTNVVHDNIYTLDYIIKMSQKKALEYNEVGESNNQISVE